MKWKFLYVILFSIICNSSYSQLNDLIIVEYVDWSSGSGWAIRVCNYSGNTINLSNYKIKVFNNASTTASLDETMSGFVANGNCIVIGNPDYNSQGCSVGFLTVSNHGVNGDDAVVITDLSDNYIDMINGVGFGTNQRIGSDNNALKFNIISRSQTNCNRYTNTSGSGPNSWPTNNSNSVPGWTVSSVSCLSNVPYNFQQPVKSSNFTICQGDSVLIGGIWRKVAGSFNEVISAPSGCDTLKTTNLIVKQSSNSNHSASICAGEIYSFNGKTYSATGTFRDTLFGANSLGCDSILILSLTQNPYVFKSINIEVCFGETYFFKNENLAITGVYKDTIAVVGDCDTIVTLDLKISSLISETVNLTLCEGDSVFLENAYRKIAGIYSDTLIAQNGCDSIINRNVSIDPILTKNKKIEICNGEQITINGVFYNADTTFTVLKQNASTCDSLITYEITVNKVPVDFNFIIDGLNVEFFNNGVSNLNYFWELGDGVDSTAFDLAHTYDTYKSYFVKLTVTDLNGCKNSTLKEVNLIEEDPFSLYIPNVFTPNGDGLNDKFHVVYSGDFEFEIFIFNRWGIKVFEANKLSFSWDGSVNGKEPYNGSYYYIVNGKYKRQGSVTILK